MGKLGNYLRALRKQWHLTQGELAFLLGYEDDSTVSRFERQKRAITPAVANACRLIFGVEPTAAFPALFDQLECDVIRRLQELCERLTQGSAASGKATAKLERLRSALDRLSPPGNKTEV